MTENLRTYYFSQGEPVVVGLCRSGIFVAYERDGDNLVRGHGHTHMAAIADLNARVCCAEPDAIDRQAARWDHERDLRKNWEGA